MIATNSTEAKFIVAYKAEENNLYIRYVLYDIGIEKHK